MTNNTAASRPRPDRALVIVLGVIVALVLIALAAILLRGGPKELDPASPEGVVQSYSTAVIAGDTTAARELLSEQLSKECAPVGFYSDPGSIRVTLLEANERDESASVSVLIRVSYGGPFGSGESESRQMFELVKEQGQWKITRTPYDLAVCEGLLN